MGGGVGLVSGDRSNGKNNDAPKTRAYEQNLNKIAMQYYRDTGPLRSEFLGQAGDLLSGRTSATDLPAFGSLAAVARRGINDQFAQAKQAILASNPRGGQLDQALAGANVTRAQDVGNSQQEIAGNLIQQLLQAGAGAAFGAPGVAESGLGSAAGAYASRYGSNAAAQANRYGAYLGAASKDYATTGELMQDVSSSCCFIFLAARGPLHPVVRRFRDEHLTPRNRRGYYRLADWLVPRMERSRFWKGAVRRLMVDPMTSFGKWFYGCGGVGILFAPVAAFWLTLFSALGFGRYVRRNGEVV